MANPTILVVDDLSDNLNILRELLTSEGYNVRLARNGKMALSFIENNLPDLILLDIKMPEMDGFEVCMKLKADERARDIPVIFLSALADSYEKTKGLQLGAVDYVTKPFDTTELLLRVRNQLKCQSLQRQLEKKNDELLELSRIKEEVENIIHHDLRGPLTPITHLPKSIRKSGPLTDKQLKHLKVIEQAGQKLIKMINQNTRIALLERGTYLYNQEKVDVLPIIMSFLDEFEIQIERLDLSFRVLLNGKRVTSDDHLFIEGETVLLYSFLSNLIRNAVEASQAGQTITVSLFDKEAIQIDIHNETSVPQKIRERFFDKYTTFGKAKGTGLGTYSAKMAVETMGGTIEMTTGSEGTTLTVCFPLPK